ncbi:homocysteine S-methyltransferase family protein [Paenibacillus donghaensis]|uniref:homocysteine S-methyltransferase family protein n=1 Tax=Paenibacillus donghaensis TaxID=414771 RepID=UPI0012FE049E
MPGSQQRQQPPIIGGCCRTTPHQIRELAQKWRSSPNDIGTLPAGPLARLTYSV